MIRVHAKRSDAAIALNITALSVLFVGFLFTTGTGFFEHSVAKQLFRAISIVILGYSALMGQKIRIDILVSLLLVVIALILNQSLLAVNIIFLLLVAASFQRFDAKEAAITLLIPTLVVVIMHLILLLTGVISVETVNVSDRVRSSLGFVNPNQTSVIYFSLAAISTFFHLVYGLRASFVLMASSCLLAVIIFIKTDSRTSLFGTIIMVLLFFTNKVAPKAAYSFFVRWLCLFGPILFFISSIYIINYVGSELDILLSLRPFVFSEFLATASTWDIIFGWSHVGVDNVYLSLLSAVGVIGCILVVVFIGIKLSKMSVEFSLLLFALLISALFESFLLRPEVPLSTLFVVMLFSKWAQRKRPA